MPTTHPPSTRPTAVIRALACAAVLSVVVGGCGAAATATPAATAAASTGGASSTAPTAAPSTAAPASVAPSVVAAIPDGVWISDPISAATVRAMFAATHLADAEKQRGLTEDFGMTPTRKQMVERLELKNGSWVESGGWDGEPMTVGAEGSFAFPDAHSIAMQDHVSLITYKVDLTGTSLRLTMVSDSATTDLADDVGPVIVFCTATWHLQG